MVSETRGTRALLSFVGRGGSDAKSSDVGGHQESRGEGTVGSNGLVMGILGRKTVNDTSLL